MTESNSNALGGYLKDRRAKLDPKALGFAQTRRRTPGLRREEVAQRAHVSATWYTWLEQGRGGSPSVDVLDRIAEALMLTEVEREHVFLLAFGRPPEVRFQGPSGVTPRLQRLLDAFEVSPAIVKNATWDVLAWNRAATAVLTDYSQLPPEERNILRLIFLDPKVRAAQCDWAGVARFVVAAFRADVARAGASRYAEGLVAELSRTSAEFQAMWREHNVVSYGEGTKNMRHPELGICAFEYSAFSVDGRPELSMVVYNPATREDAERVRRAVKAKARRA